MKRILAALILAPAIVGAQNLVKNATMEKEKFAAFKPRIEKADGWSNANGGTADLFVNDSRTAINGIPKNYMGTQDGGGSNYAGIIAYYGDEALRLGDIFDNLEVTSEIGYGKYTEYVQAELSEPLIAGTVYHFSVKVSLAEESDRAVRGLGAFFTPNKVDEKRNTFLNAVPQIVSRELISNKEGWTTIEGSFIAQGGERYVTIGAFPALLTVQDISSPLDRDSRKAYYYIARPHLEIGPPSSPPIVKDHAISTGADNIELMGGIFLDLHFATGSSAIGAGDAEKLHAVVNYLNDHPDVIIRIDGHADAVGDAYSNFLLSQERALAVRAYLEREGIESRRIKTSAYGEQSPIETTAAASYRNRRIELYEEE